MLSVVPVGLDTENRERLKRETCNHDHKEKGGENWGVSKSFGMVGSRKMVQVKSVKSSEVCCGSLL